MVAQRTEQQRFRDERDQAALRDGSWALRRLVDRNYFHGAGATLYAVCEVMDRVALDMAAVDAGVRSCLLNVAERAQTDARIDRERSTRP
ncbi:MAG TPA: hypothetical protein VFE65_13645 [Pseudonocardia sp.]|nr:hypothetical protein [Pseudonocardia sp.]